MSARPSHQYSTRELSKETWPDFEKLFNKKGAVGDGWWCWCTYHHRESDQVTSGKQPRTRAEWADRTHDDQRQLVKSQSSHGILVYTHGEPVGWCQYGIHAELPRVQSIRAYQKLGLQTASDKSWRITCFVIDKDHRRKGVASTALRAVLESIRKKGGGLVEAYPVGESDQGANYFYTGTVSMFERVGFKTVAPLGAGRTSRIVMQRKI